MKIYVNYASITVCTGKQTAKTITFLRKLCRAMGQKVEAISWPYSAVRSINRAHLVSAIAIRSKAAGYEKNNRDNS